MAKAHIMIEFVVPDEGVSEFLTEVKDLVARLKDKWGLKATELPKVGSYWISRRTGQKYRVTDLGAGDRVELDPVDHLIGGDSYAVNNLEKFHANYRPA